jgi:hypothetical protein
MMKFNWGKLLLASNLCLLALANMPVASEAATFMVDNAADSGTGTLRWAIEQANDKPGSDSIEFSADHTIYIRTPLPPLSDTSGGTIISGGDHEVVIDGNYVANLEYALKISSDYNVLDNLQIVNIYYPTYVNYPIYFWGHGIGIYVTGSNNFIKHCKIHNFKFYGIVLGELTTSRELPYDAGGPVTKNQIQSCFIGSADGITSQPAYTSSIGILGTENAFANTIGVNGDGINDQLEGNLISGSFKSIVIYGKENTIAGNLIGTDITGTKILRPNFYYHNFQPCISLYQNSFDTVIGTNGDGISDLLERNIISGHDMGIRIEGYPSGVRISGNYIGTNIGGGKSLPNTYGIQFYPNSPDYPHYQSTEQGEPRLLIVGTNGDGVSDEIEGNLIAGSDSAISLGTYSNPPGRSGGVKIAGNLIGTDASGLRILPFGKDRDAIRMNLSPNNIIGTDGDGIADDLEGNVISGPVFLNGSSNTRISGNRFGTDRSGNQLLSYEGSALYKYFINTGGSSYLLIGTDGDGISDELEGNVFAQHPNLFVDGPYVGIYVGSGSNQRISGNLVGLSKDGQRILGGSKLTGIYLGSSNSLIGTDGDGISDDIEGNILLGSLVTNSRAGIQINSAGGNRVSGNYIGTEPTFRIVSGFGASGIVLNRTSSNLIGTNHDGISDELEANVITNNGYSPPLGWGWDDGISIEGIANYNSILGNSIYNNAGLGIAPAGKHATINGISHDGSNFVVTGTAPVNSLVEIFIADIEPGGTGGEGKTYLDRSMAVDGTFTFLLDSLGVEDFITATATFTNGTTRGFATPVNFSGHLPPVFAEVGDQTVDTGSLLVFSVAAGSPHGIPVAIDVLHLPDGASFDGGSFSWVPEYHQAGIYYVTFIASDGLISTSETVTITVNAVNSPPALAVNGNGVVSLQDEIYLDAQVSDSDGDQVNYSWTEEGVTLCAGSISTIDGGESVDLPTCQLPAGQPLGDHSYLLEVSDGYNYPVTGTVTVTVQDSSAPTLSPTVDQAILWPPNHEMVEVTVVPNAYDDSGSLSLDVEVVSNEPETGLSEGDLGPDFSAPVIDADGTVHLQLRAERDGRGNGRIYQIVITASDDSGNVSSTTLEVLCPHDKKFH